jgi:anti-anti-sigma factor
MSAHTRQRRAPLLPLGIVVAQRGTTTIIELDGEWDRATRGAARAAIHNVFARRPSCVVLDLSRVSSIDPSGVRVVVELAWRSELEHVHFVIIPGPPAVQHVFAHCRSAGELPFVAHGAPLRSADRLASTLA